ncbi:unnamed protein product [Didymodactylos carnosus]|uniref:Uncharacterized protein n=1 Tax=Didymodactylos carnosus TaxID=1234261 RepID=A0A815YJT0_9BILA|nr:unnamed protein product [Didymodactylos carnosus]CAF1571602.1 unnamed protein product [Didymodactylos carnosus]CAF3714351.1 unnamed protein product [Didymodactylos carnosus]CAF4435200.1 unnamed protein product [Didymodactylos carnosus]
MNVVRIVDATLVVGLGDVGDARDVVGVFDTVDVVDVFDTVDVADVDDLLLVPSKCLKNQKQRAIHEMQRFLTSWHIAGALPFKEKVQLY